MNCRHISEDDFKMMVSRMTRQQDGPKDERMSGQPPHHSTLPPVSRDAAAPQFRSKWEASYASKLELEKRAGLIKAYWYEPISLWLPGKVRYKPDFLIQYPLGMERSLEMVEVKGFSRNLRDGMTRLKIAAALFPCFTWRLVRKTKGGGWDGEYL